MRKVDNGEKKKEKERENNDVVVVVNLPDCLLAHFSILKFNNISKKRMFAKC